MKLQTSLIVFFILLICINITHQTSSAQCIDKSGNKIDWWLILKLPKSFNTGKAYYYFDVNSSELLYEDSINSSTSALFRTIAQIQDLSSQDNFSMMWNDEPDGINVSSTYAHSKGIIGGNSSGKTAFVLNHSTPKFPTISSDKIDLDMSPNQQIYGQHYFCISMSYDVLNQYASNFQLNRPYVYSNHVPDKFKSELSQLVTLGENKQKTGDYATYNFKTLAGQSITQFAKSGKYNVDLYYHLVAPTYSKSFIFETWGRSLEDADCGADLKVVSNLSVKFTDSVAYSYTNDHSKYGIADSGYTVCFGDINRMTSQHTRGGGTNCFSHQKLHTIISKAFTSQQTCSKAEDSFLSLYLKQFQSYLKSINE